jgi:glucose-6-phosphate 1-dehydrogenase
MVTLLQNPLRVGLQQQRMPEPNIIVFFGASGDLTKRKLVPALYHLKRERKLPPELTIVGVARREWSDDYFREQMREGVEEFSDGVGSDALWQDFAQGLFMFLAILIIQIAIKSLENALRKSIKSATQEAIEFSTSPLLRNSSQKRFNN